MKHQTRCSEWAASKSTYKSAGRPIGKAHWLVASLKGHARTGGAWVDKHSLPITAVAIQSPSMLDSAAGAYLPQDGRAEVDFKTPTQSNTAADHLTAQPRHLRQPQAAE